MKYTKTPLEALLGGLLNEVVSDIKVIKRRRKGTENSALDQKNLRHLGWKANILMFNIAGYRKERQPKYVVQEFNIPHNATTFAYLNKLSRVVDVFIDEYHKNKFNDAKGA